VCKVYLFHADLKRLKQIVQIQEDNFKIKSAQICRICVKKNHFNLLICGFRYYFKVVLIALQLAKLNFWGR
jgi:hypothetical protein